MNHKWKVQKLHKYVSWEFGQTRCEQLKFSIERHKTMSNKLPYTKEGNLHNHNALSKQTKAKIKKNKHYEEEEIP